MGRKATKMPSWVNDIFCNTIMPVFSLQQNKIFKPHFEIVLEFWFNWFGLGDLFIINKWTFWAVPFLLCWELCLSCFSLCLSFYSLFPILGTSFCESLLKLFHYWFSLTISLGKWFPNFELWYLELTECLLMKPFSRHRK